MLGQLFSFHLPSWEPTLNFRRGSQERSVISSSWTASLMLPQERCWVGLGHYHVGFRSLCRWSWGHSSLQETFDESALWDRAVNTWCFARFTDVASREVSCLPIGMILIIPERNNRIRILERMVTSKSMFGKSRKVCLNFITWIVSWLTN